jgi:hypothetical protein
MQNEKQKLALKTVDQLKAAAKRVGANVVDPKSGKAKTKVQLINAIIMVQRLGKAKKQIKTLVKKQTDKKTAAASRQTNQRQRDIAKDIDKKAKAPGKRTSKTGKVYYERRANRSDVPPTMLGQKIQDYRAIENVRIFEAVYLGPTNVSGSRVKINDLRFKESKTIPFNYKANSEGEVAAEYLNTLGIKIVAKGETQKGMALFTKNFEKSIKDKA